jgi:hypothetical protein
LISSFITPDRVLQHLTTLYGQALARPAYYQGDDISLEERAARQFAFIHQKVLAEQKAAATAASGKPD